jgi:large repetitive protein
MEGIEHTERTRRVSPPDRARSRGVLRAIRGLALLVGALLALAAGAPATGYAVTFSGPTNYAVGNSPQAIGVGDFNGDSYPDLAIANEFSDNLSVLLGAVGGTFTGPATIAMGGHPLAVGVADFNGDSDPDLAVVNEFSNDVWVLLGGAGATFGVPNNYPVGAAPQSVVVGDFNGDSDPDLAIANEGTNNVSVLLGAAGGSFTGPTTFGAGGTPRSIAAGDFNGDSDPDLVVANEGTNNVTVLLGGAGGTFTGPTSFPTCSGPISVAVGDFNGDSDPDLVTANELCHDVSILLGGAGGSFSGPTDYAVGDLPDWVAVGEFNGDLDPDIVVANQGTDNISILSGALAATFTGPTNIVAGDGPSSVVVAQFNGDSAQDLAVTNELSNNVSIFLGTATAPAPPTLTATDPASPANDSTPKVKGTAAAGTTVRIYKAATTADCTAGNLAATGSAADFASAGLAVSVANDSSTIFRATATDPAGQSSGCSSSSLVYVEDSTAPAAPTLTATDPATPANNNSPKVKGSAESGSTVKLYTSSSCSGTPAATGTAADFASPGLTVSVADNSTTTFRATATDAAGNVSACSSSTISYTEDSSGPAAPTLTATDPASPANNNSPKLKGSAESGSTVRLYTSSNCSGTAAATGTAADFASPGLTVSVADNSTTTFRVTATDALGNVSACSTSSIAYTEDSTAPGLPTLAATDPASPANHNSPKVKGTAEAGATVKLYTSPDCSGTVAATGTAADFASPGLTVSVADDSTTIFHATATDAAGNASGCSISSIGYTEDSSGPAAPALTATDPASPANNTAPKVKGSAESGSTVRLYTSSDCSGTAAATGTAADFSSPGLAVSVADNSTTTFHATATDAFGNASGCSTSTITYTEDSSAPAAPTLTATDPASPANNNLPKVKGTAEAGTTIRIFKASTTSGCTAANLLATGSAADFSSPGIQAAAADNLSTRFRATATDGAGNVSPCSSSSILYAEDSKPPALPTLSGTDPPSPANNNSPKVKGTATAGTTVRLYKAATTSDCTPANLVATGTAAEFASPGFQVSVPDNTTTPFRATATDAAGNASGCSTSSRTYTEDSTPPGGPTFTSTDPASPANNNSPKVKGNAASGSTVRLYKAATTADCTPANLVATGTKAEFASPGFQVSVPDDSSTRFRATATDAVGNTSVCSSSSKVYVEDSTAPASPTVKSTDPVSPANNNSPRVKGSAASGTTVRVYNAATTADCTAANLFATGIASAFSSPGLLVSVPDNSTSTFRATATDAAGNSSACSTTSAIYVEDSTLP